MAVTQKQIAEALGLSRSVVGEALSGHPRIAEQTRLRVMEKARELGYDAGANSEARSLIARRYGQRLKTQTLGVVFDYASPDDTMGMLAFQGIHRAVRRHDYDVLVLKRDRHSGRTKHTLAEDTRVDGFIFVNSYELGETLAGLAASGVPTVTCMSNDNPAEIPSVMADNVGAMRLAVDHLVGLGHRKIAHIGGPMDHCDAHERRSGFLRAMEANGLLTDAGNIVNAGWTWNGLNSKVEAAVRSGFTGFVCSNDIQAVELKALAAALGLSVPGELSIVGMDNFGLSAEHGMTTVINPLVEMGRLAVEAWMKLNEGVAAQELSRIVPVDLVIRHSTARLLS